MASFASVNHHHPPFIYDPNSKPTKSILKQKSNLNRSSSWLSNINSKLAANFADTNSMETNSSVQYSISRQPQQQQQETARSLGLFRKFINNNNNTQPNDDGSMTSVGSAEGQVTLPDNDELTPGELKRVRFSVGQLTTEYYPYRKSSDTVQEEPTASSSTDAPELSEAATEHLFLSSKEPNEPVIPKDTSEPIAGKTMPAPRNSPGELLELYELACRNKEEMPLFGFVTSIKGAIDVGGLTTIDFSGQALTRRALEPLADVLGYVYQLHNLNLSNCGLEDDAVKVLLHALLLNDTLTHLNLANNKNIKTTGFKYIAIYVKGASKLEHLDLSMMSPDKKSIQYLAQAITSKTAAGNDGNTDATPTPSLKSLKLDGCLFNKAHMLEVLASGVRKSRCLRHLSLANCKINNQGAISLGVMLRDYDNTDSTAGLYQLTIDNNDIRQGIQYIGQALRRNRCLKTISMRDCKLDAKGCVFIGEALKYNQSLANLNISANALNNPNIEGILSIKQALYSNSSLEDLNLSDTGLTSEGAIALAECLPENRSLLRIDLSKNPDIELAGLMALAASLRLNQSLTFLDVNIPPNDREMAKLQSDIVAKCTANAHILEHQQDSQKSTSPSIPERSFNSVQGQGSQNGLDSRATAPTTARLTLQERLAAVTRGKAGPAVAKTAATAEEAPVTPSLPPQKPRRSEPKNVALARPVRTAEKHAVNAEMIAATVTQVTLFEELLVAEAGQRDEMADAARRPEDLILQVFGQCKKSQATISSRIPHVTNSDQLMQLLEVNDRLTTATARYQRLFTSETIDNNKQTDSVIPASETQQEEDSSAAKKNSLSPDLLYINTNDPPLSTSFEIGDVDEDDDLVPPTHPSSPGLTTSYQVE